MIIDLTLEEIKDLAEHAGFTIDQSKPPENNEMDYVVCITNCHPEGLANDDGKIEHFNYVMYFECCPEEGVIPLGNPLVKSN